MAPPSGRCGVRYRPAADTKTAGAASLAGACVVSSGRAWLFFTHYQQKRWIQIRSGRTRPSTFCRSGRKRPPASAGSTAAARRDNIYAPCSSPITIELWDSILDYFFINHTLKPGTLAQRSSLQEPPPADSAPFGSIFTASHHIPLDPRARAPHVVVEELVLGVHYDPASPKSTHRPSRQA